MVQFAFLLSAFMASVSYAKTFIEHHKIMFVLSLLAVSSAFLLAFYIVINSIQHLYFTSKNKKKIQEVARRILDSYEREEQKCDKPASHDTTSQSHTGIEEEHLNFALILNEEIEEKNALLKKNALISNEEIEKKKILLDKAIEFSKDLQLLFEEESKALTKKFLEKVSSNNLEDHKDLAWLYSTEIKSFYGYTLFTPIAPSMEKYVNSFVYNTHKYLSSISKQDLGYRIQRQKEFSENAKNSTEKKVFDFVFDLSSKLSQDYSVKQCMQDHQDELKRILEETYLQEFCYNLLSAGIFNKNDYFREGTLVISDRNKDFLFMHSLQIPFSESKTYEKVEGIIESYLGENFTRSDILSVLSAFHQNRKINQSKHMYDDANANSNLEKQKKLIVEQALGDLKSNPDLKKNISNFLVSNKKAFDDRFHLSYNDKDGIQKKYCTAYFNAISELLLEIISVDIEKNKSILQIALQSSHMEGDILQINIDKFAPLALKNISISTSDQNYKKSGLVLNEIIDQQKLNDITETLRNDLELIDKNNSDDVEKAQNIKILYDWLQDVCPSISPEMLSTKQSDKINTQINQPESFLMSPIQPGKNKMPISVR